MNWECQFQSIPFAEKGRDPITGMDCWGFFQHAYSVVHGIVLPSFLDQYDGTGDADAIRESFVRNREDWTRVIDGADLAESPQRWDELNEFDGIWAKAMGVDTHVMIYTGFREAVHISKESGVGRVDLQDSIWRHRVVSVWRHQHLA